ncbi:glycosyltransferase family 39 protein [Lysobacter sp. TY2-98]|uniref:ArnT family glycosyltransferase n=1 Tax=Lysobacter sp. TY2-98 TaxID=2290922 RepID=UPI0013B445CE|nr:glycosyltransferase family 39 protein [Lysobacter sp. TY2-98]
MLVVLALAFLGSRGLWDPDEGRYTNVALNMLARGDWLVPHRSFEVAHWTKPPLAYWAIATGFSMLGVSTWAARLAPALAYLISAFAVARIGRRLVPGQGPRPALVFGTLLLPAVASQLVTTDMVLTACESLAMWGYVERRWGDGRQRWLLLMYAAFGLAFLTKGPPGLLPALAIIATEFLVPQPRRILSASGMAVFALVAFPWFIAVVATSPGLLHYLLTQEVVGRVASNDFGRHGEWYGWAVVYGPALVVGTSPWLLPLLRSLRTARAEFRGEMRDGRRVRDDVVVFLATWILLPLIVFCIARSRLPLYVLPIMAPIALLVVRTYANGGRAFPTRLLIAWCVVLFAIRAAGGFIPSKQDARALASQIQQRLDGPVSQVVFVDDVPRYGLRLHLGVEVESVALHAPANHPSPDVDETMDRELATRDALDGIWLTPEAHFPAVLAHLRATHFDARPLGTPLQGRVLFRIQRHAALP